MRPMQLHDPGVALATLEVPRDDDIFFADKQVSRRRARRRTRVRKHPPYARDALTECVCSACAQAGWPTRARAVRSASGFGLAVDGV